MDAMDELAKQYGFESRTEMVKLIAHVDLTTQTKRIAFKFWKNNDGTKEGLLKLLEDEGK